MQGYHPAAVRRYWLTVLTHNLNSNAGSVATVCATTLLWFLWHFTASAVPRPLRSALCSAIQGFCSSTVDCTSAGNDEHGAQCTCKACPQRRRYELGQMLLWLLATDSAAASLLPAGVQPLAGARLQELQAGMLQEVRCDRACYMGRVASASML